MRCCRNRHFNRERLTREQSRLAFEGYRRWGKGVHPDQPSILATAPPMLLAKSLDAPLLFKGEDFARTDVRRAP